MRFFPQGFSTVSTPLYLFPFFWLGESIPLEKSSPDSAAKLPLKMHKPNLLKNTVPFVHKIQHAQKENARINSIPPAPSLCD